VLPSPYMLWYAFNDMVTIPQHLINKYSTNFSSRYLQLSKQANTHVSSNNYHQQPQLTPQQVRIRLQYQRQDRYQENFTLHTWQTMRLFLILTWSRGFCNERYSREVGQRRGARCSVTSVVYKSLSQWWARQGAREAKGEFRRIREEHGQINKSIIRRT